MYISAMGSTQMVYMPTSVPAEMGRNLYIFTDSKAGRATKLIERKHSQYFASELKACKCQHWYKHF